MYYDCRCLSPCEAAWRIFAYDIHERRAAVQRLNFHLPNKKLIYFKDEDEINNVVDTNAEIKTMFLAWFEANKIYVEGRDLIYAEFPTRFVWLNQQKRWQPRKKGYSIGRLFYIPAGVGELYYLRILLTIQRGCVDYDSIKTVNGQIYSNFQDACYALGLLMDDIEYIDAIKETSDMGSGN